MVVRIMHGRARMLHLSRATYKKFRLEAYLRILDLVARRDKKLNLMVWASPTDYCPGNNATVGQHDFYASHFGNVPILCFQRYDENYRAVLLPEIQMIYSDFYSKERTFRSQFSWDIKSSDKAWFRGGMTGPFSGFRNQRVRMCSKWATHPNGSVFPLEHWRLGLDCKLFTDENDSKLLRLGYEVNSTNKTSLWADLLSNKYLLSMDGYGATCSRVFKSLLSNSVLLKLETKPKSSLYYFSGLEAWQHFVPVQENNIGQIVTHLQRDDRLGRDISRAATQFALREITREKSVKYTHLLLSTLMSLKVP
eukprot:CAMPEP_0198213736 /NCGR_PEP_ID=MMETSP1445-20131203/31958_1 /TAXON_ID=36898 /ORGANISM="Pyramimonas sp., Strain CCMP2087" /LENGTH=307 /DNA_ID=CAMNT_0043888481 /DNA_START=502 /DNA_END=1425 /DNA_ORIENTATION=-